MSNKRVILILFLFIIAMGAISSVSANDSGDGLIGNGGYDEIGIDEAINDLNQEGEETLDLESDEDVLESSDKGTFTELQTIIYDASEGSTISLDKDYCCDDDFKNIGYGIQINKSITINGNKHILDGASKTNIFQAISSKNIVFNGITFQNGYFDSDSVPGSFYVDYLKFNECRFINNKGASFGGAITVAFVNECSFVKCDFEGNRANAGGAIFLQNVSSSTFDSCTFANNLAVGGGAIYSCKSGDFSFKSCVFEGNWAEKGGAICLEVIDSLKVDSCDFNDNHAIGMGGTFYLHVVEDSQFSSCTFSKTNANNGGVFYCDSGNLDLTNSNFTNSMAIGYGGLIDSIYSNIAVNACNFYDYYSYSDAGGAIYNVKGNLSISDSTFRYGYSKKSGGSISSLRSNLTISSTEFLVNLAENYGGSIYTIYGSIDVEDCIFNGTSAFQGSAIYSEIPNHSSFKNNIFLDTTSSSSVGASISIISSNGEIIESGNHFEGAYHLYMDYVGYLNDEKFTVQSDTLHYILSNDGVYLYSYDIIDSKGSNSNFASIEIWDPDYPNNTTIFRDYNDTLRPTYNFTKSRYFNDGYVEYLNYYVYNDNHDLLLRLEKPNMQELLQLVNASTLYLGSNMIYENSYPTDVGLTKYPILLVNSSPSDVTSIPLSYDSRKYGYITSVKDQDDGGNCWAFSGIATLEACLKKITNVTYDFSEENVKNLMATYSCLGLNMETNNGGYDSMLMSYLTSWTGPINDQLENYHGSSLISAHYINQLTVQNIKFLPARQNSADNNIIKKAIMDYGAVAVTFDWAGEGLHAVSLVGWDDNYRAKDSLGEYTKGAWLFKNSWGTEWGNDGFGYLSYNVPFTSDTRDYVHAYTFAFDKNDAYINNYQLEHAGVTDYMYSEGPIYCSNSFTSSGNLEYLTAFATYFKNPAKYTVSVYKNNVLVLSQSGYSDAGYYTIPFNKKIKLDKYEEFTIRIALNNDEYNLFPVCQSSELNNVNFEVGTSFVSFDGKKWYDLYDLKEYQEFLYGPTKKNTCQVACIKAFTSMYDDLYGINLEVSEFDHVDANKKVIIEMTLSDLGIYNFNSIGKINNTFVTIKINGKDYYALIDGNKASLSISFDKEGSYTLTAQYKNNLFESNIVKFDFIVGRENVALSAKAVSKVYGGSEKSLVTLKDGKGNPIVNADINVVLNGKSSSIQTNAKGQAYIPISLAPNTYTVTVSYAGNAKYQSAGIKVKIVVKKATPKITASKKTFKLKTKTKKYTITLKNNLGKVMKNTKVSIKVNGKTYTAKTNSKGKVTFKITKLKKKGSFKSTITYAGSKYYNKVTKKVTITVKK